MSVYSLAGYNIAYGYSLTKDEFSSTAHVLGPQTSTQLNSDANHDSVSPRVGTQNMWHQSFGSLQREPAHHEYTEDIGSVTGPREAKHMQSKPDSDQSVAAPTPFLQKYEKVNSGYHHPFGLLVKEHAQMKKTVDGISFPTIKDFKGFIDSMKSSYLTPGSDLSRHFQTALQTMKNEMASGAQNINSSNSVEEGSAHEDTSGNKVWSEPMNSMFEQSKQDANYEMPSESLSVLHPLISTAGLISPSVHESPDFRLGSALNPSPRIAATEHESSNYGSSSNAVFSGEKHELLTHPLDKQNKDVKSTSYELPEQIPLSSSLLYGEDFSSSGHRTASPLDPQVSSAQDLRYYSSKQKIHPYTSHSKDFPEYQKPSDASKLSKYFQSGNPDKVTPQKPSSSYGKGFYVRAPRIQPPLSNVPDQLLTHVERPAPSLQRYQSTVSKESKDINFSPAVHLPVSSGSVSSSPNILSPQSSSGHVGVQASSHERQNQVFSRKQPVKSHLWFTVKPSSSLHGSSIHNGYVVDQSVSVPHHSILYARTKDEKSDLSKQALVSAIEEPKRITENDLDVSFNSLTNVAPTSKSNKAFLAGNEVMSRSFGTQNMYSDMFPNDMYGVRKPLLRQSISLNEDYVSATRTGLPQTFIQPTKEKHPANMNKKPSRPLKLLHPTSEVFGSTLSGVLWRNDGYRKRLQTGPDRSLSSVNAYVVSRNGYIRDKVSQSKSRYTPHSD
ncbi:hypothetical protein PAMP_019594 [Pampus punctatissimus]